MPEYLETTAEKFTFRVATDRLYSPQGVWVKPDPSTGRVHMGLADYLQQHNGDVAFANVKLAGTQVIAGALVAEIETIKAMVEVASPISGTVIEANSALSVAPEAINHHLTRPAGSLSWNRRRGKRSAPSCWTHPAILPLCKLKCRRI